MTHGSAGEPAESEQVALHAVARGRVQGVGYREFARRNALALGLRGWVRNLPDGRTVELRAVGSRPALARLVELLREGPRFAFVDEVGVDWQMANERETPTFEIRF